MLRNYVKSYLKRKKVARNTTSCQNVGEQLVESSREKGEGEEGGGGVGGYSIKLQVAKTLASNLWKALGRRGRGGGLGGYSTKLCSQRLRPEVQCLTLKYTIFAKGIPFVYLPLKGCTLFIYLLLYVRINREERRSSGHFRVTLTCKWHCHKACFFEAF